MMESFIYLFYLLFYKCYNVCPATSCGPCTYVTEYYATSIENLNQNKCSTLRVEQWQKWQRMGCLTSGRAKVNKRGLYGLLLTDMQKIY